MRTVKPASNMHAATPVTTSATCAMSKAPSTTSHHGNAHFTRASINVRPVENGVVEILHSFPCASLLTPAHTNMRPRAILTSTRSAFTRGMQPLQLCRGKTPWHAARHPLECGDALLAPPRNSDLRKAHRSGDCSRCGQVSLQLLVPH